MCGLQVLIKFKLHSWIKSQSQSQPHSHKEKTSMTWKHSSLCLCRACHFPCYQASQQTFSDDWKDSKWFILPSMSPIMLSSICFGPTMNIDPSIVNEWFCTALGSTKPSNPSELATVSEMTLSMLIGGTFRNVQKNKHEKNYGIVTDDSWHTKC